MGKGQYSILLVIANACKQGKESQTMQKARNILEDYKVRGLLTPHQYEHIETILKQ